jgi:hypothetical protein
VYTINVVNDDEYLFFLISFLAYQEDINGSTVLINPTLVQQQTPNNSTIVEDGNDSNESELQGGNPSQELTNDVVVNQQSPIEAPQHNLNQIMTFGDNNSQRSKEKQTFRPPDPIQDEENLTSPDLSRIMSMNVFSGDNSLNDQQRASKSSFDESREEKPTGFDTRRSEGLRTFGPSDPIQDLSQIMNMPIFSSDNSQNDQQDYQNSTNGALSEEQSTSFNSVNGSTSTRNALPRRSNSNSSMMKESNGNDINKELDLKENIRGVLESQKCNLETQIEYDKDLAKHIPGLYRLLDLCKDDGSNGLGKFLTFICVNLIKFSL